MVADRIFVLTIFLGIASATGDILEYFQPKNDNPAPLNAFLTNVQNHKNDFVTIRKTLNILEHKKRRKTDGSENLKNEKDFIGKRTSRKVAGGRRKNKAKLPQRTRRELDKNLEVDVLPRSENGNVDFQMKDRVSSKWCRGLDGELRRCPDKPGLQLQARDESTLETIELGEYLSKSELGQSQPEPIIPDKTNEKNIQMLPSKNGFIQIIKNSANMASFDNAEPITTENEVNEINKKRSEETINFQSRKLQSSLEEPREKKGLTDIFSLQNDEDYLNDNEFLEEITTIKTNHSNLLKDKIDKNYKEHFEDSPAACGFQDRKNGICTTPNSVNNQLGTTMKPVNLEKREKTFDMDKVSDFDNVIENRPARNAEQLFNEKIKTNKISNSDKMSMSDKEKKNVYRESESQTEAAKADELMEIPTMDLSGLSTFDLNSLHLFPTENLQEKAIIEERDEESHVPITTKSVDDKEIMGDLKEEPFVIDVKEATEEVPIESTPASHPNLFGDHTKTKTEETTKFNIEEPDELYDVLNGGVAIRIIQKVFDKLKQKSSTRNRLFLQLSHRAHKLIDLFDFKMVETKNHTDEETDSARHILDQMSKVINKVIVNEIHRMTCHRLPRQLEDYLKFITAGGDEPRMRFRDEPTDNQADYLFGQNRPQFDQGGDLAEAEALIDSLESLLLQYKNLNPECQNRAEPIRAYIEKHLDMLKQIVMCISTDCPDAPEGGLDDLKDNHENVKHKRMNKKLFSTFEQNSSDKFRKLKRTVEQRKRQIPDER